MKNNNKEYERALALKSLDILDTPPEERFERLTRLATRIFNVPIAQITLLDGDRQWFKSIKGSELTEVPREITFCTHTVETESGVMVVNDASKDKRFDDNPVVHDGPKVRFYAGCSLSYSDNIRLGTLCILDVKSREMSDEDIELLKDLAAVAQREIVTIQLAMLDELTGLSNRRGFLNRAKGLIDLNKENNIKTTLVFIDLDNFKDINDNLGHEAGDNALIDFSRELLKNVRVTDLVARIGGDEFVVLFSQASIKNIETTFSRLKSSLEEYKINNNKPYIIEFSKGIKGVDFSRKIDITDLLNESDKLMYSEKKSKSP